MEPLKRFSWGGIKETLASLRNVMPTAERTQVAGDDVTRIRPGEGATWIESPGGTDKSQRSTEGGANSRAEVNDSGSKTLATIALCFAFVGGVAGVGAWIRADANASALEQTQRMWTAEHERTAASWNSQHTQAMDEFKAVKTQMWLVERRLMDKEALEIIHGDKLPSDSEFGATGNMQRMKPKEKAHGR